MVYKKRILPNEVEGSTVKESKYKNKRVLLTDAGTILKPELIQQLGRMGLTPQTGEKFDSELEAVYYRDELIPRIIAGEIEVTRQPKFEILKGFTKDGTIFKPIFYIPDFLVKYVVGGKIEAVDVKGFQNDVFLLKRKLFDAMYPDIKLLILKRVHKYGGWITVEEYAAHKKRERKEYRSLTSRTSRRQRHGTDSR